MQHHRKNTKNAVFTLLIQTTIVLVSIVHMAYADLNPLTAKHHTVYVQETAGFDRAGEPVDTEIKFFQPMPSKEETGVGDIVKKGIRVFRITDTDDWEEITFQAYDIRPYHWNRRSEIPELMVRVRIAFFATVAANMTETYHICYAVPDSKPPRSVTITSTSDGMPMTGGTPAWKSRKAHPTMKKTPMCSSNGTVKRNSSLSTICGSN